MECSASLGGIILAMKRDLLDALCATPLLAGLTEEELELLADNCTVRSLDRRETLFLEGDPVTGFYLVLNGLVKIFKLSVGGKEQVLHLAGPGQTFAEAAIFGFAAYPAGAAAVEPSEVLLIPRERFAALLDQYPDLCRRMLGALAVWLRRMTDIIASLAFKDVETRVAAYLLELCRSSHGKLEPGLEIELGIEKSLLASYMGTIPETFSRVLRRLQDKGWIGVSGTTITILDPESLSEILELD